jgi:hypothetical protein
MAHLSFALALAVKMAVTAGLVVAAARIAERAGPLLGALVATLPISAGPAYVFVSLDHGPAFVAASALASLVMNAATTLLALTYVLLAQRRGRGVRLAAALGVWLASALLLRTCRGRSAGRWPSTGWWLRAGSRSAGPGRIHRCRRWCGAGTMCPPGRRLSPPWWRLWWGSAPRWDRS